MKHVGIEIKFYNLDTFKKQIGVNFIDLDSELVDLNGKVASLIFCHVWRSIESSTWAFLSSATWCVKTKNLTSTHQSYLFNGIKGNFIGPWARSNGSRDYRYHLMWLGYFRHSIFRFFLVFLAISFQADAIFSWTEKGLDLMQFLSLFGRVFVSRSILDICKTETTKARSMWSLLLGHCRIMHRVSLIAKLQYFRPLIRACSHLRFKLLLQLDIGTFWLI